MSVSAKALLPGKIRRDAGIGKRLGLRPTVIFSAFALAMTAAPAFPEGQAGTREPQVSRQEIEGAPEPSAGMGAMDIPGPHGGKDKIYYSITTREEESKAGQEEKEKLEKSWDVLTNTVIDGRRRR